MGFNILSDILTVYEQIFFLKKHRKWPGYGFKPVKYVFQTERRKMEYLSSLFITPYNQLRSFRTKTISYKDHFIHKRPFRIIHKHRSQLVQGFCVQVGNWIFSS